jgi:membrane protein
LTNNAVQDLLSSLEKGGLLAELAGEDTRYVPAQDVDAIKVAAVLHCLRTAEENPSFGLRSLADTGVNKLLQDLSTAQADVLGDLTLKQLALRKIND